MATRKKPEIKGLYYITHVEDLRSILRDGIFSHRLIEEKGIEYKPIYDGEIVAHRGLKKTPSGRSLWTYANTYFQPRNPMLYRVIHEKGCKEIVVLALRPSILSVPDSYITDGNAANTPTQFFQVGQGLKEISENWATIQSEWWNSQDGSKRRIMAEFLVPNAIPAEDIHTIYVANHDAAERARSIVGSVRPIVPEPSMFFLPARRHEITKRLFLAEGDMFFSNMQTLTLSVNTVGIMGKGLASRAKYQFPDVYVRYQDACRQKNSLWASRTYTSGRRLTMTSLWTNPMESNSQTE